MEIVITKPELTTIKSKIYEIREVKVMLDFDLAEIYHVETKYFKRQIKRNLERFPADFMFELTENEWINLRCHFGTSSWGGMRYLPYAFTEHGVTMLASVLKSKTAIEINLHIVRSFIALRQYALGYAELNQKLENFMLSTNTQLSEIYELLDEFSEQKKIIDEKPPNKIGFVLR
jgi:hypothetical protein